MGAGDAQGVFIAPHYRPPCLGALKNRNTQLVGADYLGIIVMGSRGAHDKLRAGRDVFRIVADIYVYALFPQVRGALAFGDIGAAYYEPRVLQDLRQRRHGHAADTDKVSLSALG